MAVQAEKGLMPVFYKTLGLEPPGSVFPPERAPLCNNPRMIYLFWDSLSSQTKCHSLVTDDQYCGYHGCFVQEGLSFAKSSLPPKFLPWQWPDDIRLSHTYFCHQLWFKNSSIPPIVHGDESICGKPSGKTHSHILKQWQQFMCIMDATAAESSLAAMQFIQALALWLLVMKASPLPHCILRVLRMPWPCQTKYLFCLAAQTNDNVQRFLVSSHFTTHCSHSHTRVLEQLLLLLFC